jgi:SAM-dependent methyltransferase
LIALPWPLPAVLTWAAAWALCGLLWHQQAPAWLALALPLAMGVVLAFLGAQGLRRRLLLGLGFPLSAAATGLTAGMPAWSWLLLLAPLLLLYPLRAWRDAPLFPTPAGALKALPARLGRRASVLDAGCGLGDGLLALRDAWPHARVHGIEWSPLLALASRLRCRFATVRRGDMWASSWAGHDLVYLFQRPESMPRAWHKACSDMDPGAVLVSLEFEVPGQQPIAQWQTPQGRSVFAYLPVADTKAFSTARSPRR